MLAIVLMSGVLAPRQVKAAPAKSPTSRVEINLAGPGWSLWRDEKAAWKNDQLFAPPVDLAKLPSNTPTGGWEQLQTGSALAVSVPGTVEEYLFQNHNPAESNPEKLYGSLQGVSWWFRALHVPSIPKGGRLLLRFDAVRLRAEVYVNQKLVGYDLVGNTPFEVDITDAVQPGADCQLAVRVTNPGGNWHWADFMTIKWGKNQIPMSHSFGGITGGVKMLAVGEVYVDDLYVQNTPAMREVNVQLTVRNCSAKSIQRDVTVRVAEKSSPAVEVFSQTLKDVVFAPGENHTSVKVSVPNAKLWDLEKPNLYLCQAELKLADEVSDRDQRTFGFRWFAPENIGDNAVLRLNGKRIVLRTAISWGFWPTNGMTPTAELAEKQIRTAKELGLNMLNFHRCIGQPIVLDKADEMGLLYFEEPGGYVSGGREKLGQEMAREKLLRMVKRDRSHPSLVIYNMINEQWKEFGANTDNALHAVHEQDMRKAHALDPSRQIVFASAWAAKSDQEERVKMNMRPFDEQLYLNGWWDSHRAAGPVVWLQDSYKNPRSHYGNTENKHEIVYWGEEGAVSAPPRLEKIKADVEAMKYPGWDGQIYLSWYKIFADFLQRKNLVSSFPSVDALTCAMGVVSLEHQGRKIEDTRICDLNDGYAVNGWEAMPFENHSGIVDCFRNPEANASIVAYYNQPLYVAVKVRNQVLQIPGEVVTDFYAINEKNLAGPHTLKIRATDPAGREIYTKELPVTLQGSEIYGQLLSEEVKVPVESATGMIRIEAELTDPAGTVRARGRDEILSVDWKGAKLTGKGAVYEQGNAVSNFLQKQKGMEVPAFDDTQGPLDWIVIARPPHAEPLVIGEDAFVDADGHRKGLDVTFFKDHRFAEKLHHRVDAQLDVQWAKGATPDSAVTQIDDFAVRWEGWVLPPAPGSYLFQLRSEAGKSRLWVNGQEMFGDSPQGAIALEAGKPVRIKAEYFEARGKKAVQLLWSTPMQKKIEPARFIQRAREEGTTLIILENADLWAEASQQELGIKYQGSFVVGNAWVGGQYFVRSHPLFKDLPVNQALNWPYQQVVRGSHTRYGMLMEGEELVAACYQTMGCKLGTAVGIIPCGKGRVLFSALEIGSRLNEPAGPADVARKLLCNYMQWAGERQ